MSHGKWISKRMVDYQGLMVSKEKAELFKRLRIKFNLDAKSDLGYIPWGWDGVEYYGLESIDPYSTGVTFIRYDKSYLKSVSFEKMLNDKVKDESVREEILEKVSEYKEGIQLKTNHLGITVDATQASQTLSNFNEAIEDIKMRLKAIEQNYPFIEIGINMNFNEKKFKDSLVTKFGDDGYVRLEYENQGNRLSDSEIAILVDIATQNAMEKCKRDGVYDYKLFVDNKFFKKGVIE